MTWIAVAAKVAEAIASQQSQQSQNAWMAEVVDQLGEINQKLDYLLDEVKKLQEKIDRLPSKIDEILKDIEDARVLGARQAILEMLQTSSLTELSPAMLNSLSTHLTALAGQEGLLENKWGYSSWWAIYVGFLTRAAGYKLLSAYNSAWKTQLSVALDRKIQFFESGISAAEHASGPGKALSDRIDECHKIEQAINPCLGTTVQICWYKGRIIDPPHSGGNNFAWIVWTQSYISGGIPNGRVWMEPNPERQQEILTVEESKPEFVGRVYSPVGCPELVFGQDQFNIDMVYDKRRLIESDMNGRISRHGIASDTIVHLTPIVEGMKEALKSLREMKNMIG